MEFKTDLSVGPGNLAQPYLTGASRRVFSICYEDFQWLPHWSPLTYRTTECAGRQVEAGSTAP
jgi:hypothetical protein